MKFFKIIFLATLASVFMTSAAGAVSADFAQSYTTTQNISFGTFVSHVDGSENKIEPMSSSNLVRYVGVYIGDEGATLAVNKQVAKSQVAVSGNAVALVTSVAGDVKKGDLLAVSSIVGVAEKANTGASIVGIAREDFNNSNPKNSNVNVSLSSGETKVATIGPLEIEIYTAKQNESLEAKPGIVSWLERMAGKQITPFKFIAILIIIALLLTSITVMAYAAISNTIVQASRNPLAKPVIMHALSRIFAIIGVVVVAGLVLIYVVLKI